MRRYLPYIVAHSATKIRIKCGKSKNDGLKSGVICQMLLVALPFGGGGGGPYSLPTQPFKERNHLFPRLERIATEGDGRAHEVGIRLRVDEIIAIEEVLLIGEHHTIVGRCREIFLHPTLHFVRVSMVVCGHRRHDIHLIVLQQQLIGFVHAA